MGRSSSSLVTARPRQSVVVIGAVYSSRQRSSALRLGCHVVPLAADVLGRLALVVQLIEPVAVLVLLPLAAALGAVGESVIGGQEIAVRRCVGEQFRVRADARDGPALDQ